jgi:uncharacterized protein
MADRLPPLPSTAVSAGEKARLAEGGWNGRDPERVSLAHAEIACWCNRAEFLTGGNQLVEIARRKRVRELDCLLIEELWAFHNNRIAVRFACINNLPIAEAHQKVHRPLGGRPNDRPEFSNPGM